MVMVMLWGLRDGDSDVTAMMITVTVVVTVVATEIIVDDGVLVG